MLLNKIIMTIMMIIAGTVLANPATDTEEAQDEVLPGELDHLHKHHHQHHQDVHH